MQMCIHVSLSLVFIHSTVCLILSLPHLPWLSSGPGSKHTCLTFLTLSPCDCTVPAQWRLVAFDTIIVLAYLLTVNWLRRIFDLMSHFQDGGHDVITTHSLLTFALVPHHILPVVFLKPTVQPGLQFPLAAHTSASDSAFGRHCAL